MVIEDFFHIEKQTVKTPEVETKHLNPTLEQG